MIMSLLSTSEAGPLLPPTNVDAYNLDSNSFSIFGAYQRVSEVIASLSSFPLWIRTTLGHFYSTASTWLMLVHFTYILPEQLAKLSASKTLSRVTSRRRTMSGLFWIEHRREPVSDILLPDSDTNVQGQDEDLFSPTDEVLFSPPITTHPDLAAPKSGSSASEYDPPLTASIPPSLAVHLPSICVSNPTNPKPKWEDDIVFASARSQYDPDDRNLEDISETRSYFDACDTYYRRRKECSREGRGKIALRCFVGSSGF